MNRNNSEVTITYTPDSNTYNQLYNLLNIDHSVANKLFTTPEYPGSHYQMGVDLWSGIGQLVESQRVNVTTVYGYYLEVPNITFDIPKDADSKGLF